MINRCAETVDERAERLLDAGLEVAVRVRDEAPDDAAADLQAMTWHELRDMVVLLAACVDIEHTADELTAWTGSLPVSLDGRDIPALQHRAPNHGRRRSIQPCGTKAAYDRHLYHGQPPCEPCRDAYRAYERGRKRRPTWTRAA